MRLNPVPFIFLPGAVLLGYWIGDFEGAAVGLAAWAAVMGAATGISWLVRRREQQRDDPPPAPGGGWAPGLQFLPRFFPYRTRR